MVRSQVGAVPEHAPVQFVKWKPAAGVAEKETVVPCVAVWAHTPPAPHVTEPLPEVLTETFNEVAKLAVTVCASFNVTVQGPCAPAHAPPQPTKTLPDAGLAVSVTVAPAL